MTVTLITESTAPPGLLTSWAEYDDELWEAFYERFGDDIADYNIALIHNGSSKLTSNIYRNSSRTPHGTGLSRIQAQPESPLG